MLVTLLLALASTPVPCQGSSGCVVEVQVNNTRLRLLVDSGADLVVLTRGGAQRAGIAVRGDGPIIQARGVAGAAAAWLARANVAVGGMKEESVLLAVMPSLEMGAPDGLLGMSYLERFRFTLGARALELTPIDQSDTPKPGGRGQSWWQLRFRRTKERVDGYERLVAAAREHDQRTAREIGTSLSGVTVEDLMKRLRSFADDEQQELDNAAARAGVPREWRR
jgi:clan AA aspartic protease (TIGR02281 family)